jgi:hypothetical protein
LNLQPFWQHFKALTSKQSPRMMEKNDIAKYINTYFEQKNDLKNTTI